MNAAVPNRFVRRLAVVALTTATDAVARAGSTFVLE